MNITCSIGGCAKRPHARGLCPQHYQRARLGRGEPERQPLGERFWSKVERTPTCWLWRGAINARGYGAFNAPAGWPRLAPRMAFELTHGQGSAAEMLVCHRCDTPACVRPDHLFLGAAKDNAVDASRKGRLVGNPTGSPKLTREVVDVIRSRRRAGARITDLARGLGVSTSAISRICNGRAWANHQES